MSALLEASHHLALAFAGPVLPVDKSLILLVGDGYIAGYFFGSIVLPDAADLHEDEPSHRASLDAEVEVWRRRWGIAVAIAFALVWVVGNLKTPSSFPIAPADHNLFGAIPLVGIGALAAAMYSPFVVKHLMKNPERALSQMATEHQMGERYERLFGGVLAAVYVGVWLNPW